MRNSPFWWILVGFMILLDIYCFQALKIVSQSASSRMKTIIYASYWIISALAIISLLVLPYLHFENQARLARSTIFAIIAGLFFAKLIAAFFFFIDDIRRLVQWIAGKFSSSSKPLGADKAENISRSAFLSWVGMIAGGGLFGSLVYGFGNKYRYQLKRFQLSYANLPPAFRGLRIVHISDIHSGSFNDKQAVMRGVEKIMEEKPDMILFTGDLVNNTADEMNDYVDVFNKLNAPLGVFSILGNHDYGDYVGWPDRDEAHERREKEEDRHIWTPLQEANLERLKQVHHDLGWRLLIDEHVTVTRGEESIAVLGVQNWSDKARFPKYGDLKKAYSNAASHPFKILLSHDPSHWDAEIIKHYPDIDLMLAGHTHGFQFGVEIPGLRWSPVQYVYRHWAGLYEQGKQKLYVNRGYGFIGYPGRVGILPEITVLELV